MRRLYLLTYSVILLILVGSLSAQRSQSMDASRRQNMFGRELLTYKYYNFADTTSERLSRMDFHVGVVNDLLTFIKRDDDTYKARYEVIVIFYNDKKEALVERAVANRIVAQNFVETNSRKQPSHHSISISLPPDTYKGVLKLADLESGESITNELNVTFRDFSRDRVHLSDIMFVDKIDTTETGIVYTPNLQHVFDDVNSEFSAYVELYPPENNKPVEAQFSILTKKGDKIFTATRTYEAGKNVISAVVPFREHLNRPGEYYFILGAQSGKETAKIQRMFRVFWGNVPMARHNMDVAIEQLSLVANKRTVDSMRDASEEERQRLFDAFWEERDPTPETRRNELKEEFFKRIDFANRTFTEITSGREGWQTDRGRIYIVYGPPEQVDHRDSEMNVPATETWNYTRLNRRYYFVDRNGEGVYRLVKVE